MLHPNLQFAVAVRNLHFIQNINLLEAIQKCATRQIPSVIHSIYLKRIASLDISTLNFIDGRPQDHPISFQQQLWPPF